MSSTSSAITFNGSSTYASSFQQVIQRAVSIASLPISALQSNVSTMTSQKTALAGLDANFATVQASLQALGSAAAGTFSATSSDSSKVSATATSAAFAGTYKVQVDDPGSSTVTLSHLGSITVADPTAGNISSSTSFTLTVNGVQTTINPSGTSLTSLASAINAANAGVQATVINVGSGTSPDYRLAVTSTNLGGDTIQLNDGTKDLLDTLSTGTPALYEVNGSTTQLQSTTSQITLSPGLTANLLAQTTGSVTITVAKDFSALYSGINNFVSAYNSAVDALAQNRGQAGGALSGDSIVYTLTNVLNQIAQYSSASGGPLTSLAGLGVTPDDTGHLQFDQSVFASTNDSDIQTFFGSLTSGSAFLNTANTALNFVTNSTTGIIPDEVNSLTSQITDTNTKITSQQANITQLENNLQAQLSQADAAIATLQGQKTYFQELFQAEYGNSSTNG